MSWLRASERGGGLRRGLDFCCELGNKQKENTLINPESNTLNEGFNLLLSSLSLHPRAFVSKLLSKRALGSPFVKEATAQMPGQEDDGFNAR